MVAHEIVIVGLGVLFVAILVWAAIESYYYKRGKR